MHTLASASPDSSRGRPGQHAAKRRRAKLSPTHARKAPRRLREQEALEEVATDRDERVALGAGFDTLGDDGDAERLAERLQRCDQAALDRLPIDAAYERHVELDDFGLKVREARQGRVPGAEIVHGDAIAVGAQRRDTILNVAKLLERSAFRDLEHDA